ncbi:MAG: pyridoxal-phosphate dependent enzyme, partial [Planctomycetales bacterium]|nr:pyridoxal-phosphate dependent enzyme [Planctomycetales bacterium]
RLDRYLDVSDVELYAKLEFANPGGSAKDRPALRMVDEALRRGAIQADGYVIESSSGNMGIGLAQACRWHRLKFVCVVDPRAQPQNVAIMRALGAEIVCVTEPDSQSGDFLTARLATVRRLLQQRPGGYWPNQYANRANPAAQQELAREIDEALGGELDCVFVATSSTGAAGGCQDYFRLNRPRVQIIAVDAQHSVLFGGSPGPRRLPGMGAGKVPPLARGRQFDGVERVADRDCVVGCRRLAAREALLCGASGGGVLETVRRLQALLAGKRCVAVLHDSGTRYLDTVFNDEWVETELGFRPSESKETCCGLPVHVGSWQPAETLCL